MELATNFEAPFTQWIVKLGVLKSRFVLIDVGVQGGPHQRWELLGPMLEVHGFDPLSEAIAPLLARNVPNHHYYELAIGSMCDTATLHIGADPCGSSLYDHLDGRPKRSVRLATLDSLFADGAIPKADFIKLDCEGYEPEVLKGARELCSASPLLGAEVETSFNISPVLPETHFWASYRPLLDRGLLLFDVEFERFARPSFRGARTRARPSTWEVLFARDLPFERANSSSFLNPPHSPTCDDILKSAIMFELFGMIDVAYDTVLMFREELQKVIDVSWALMLLGAAHAA
jgi:FkbM family methyltransferase